MFFALELVIVSELHLMNCFRSFWIMIVDWVLPLFFHVDELCLIEFVVVIVFLVVPDFHFIEPPLLILLFEFFWANSEFFCLNVVSFILEF